MAIGQGKKYSALAKAAAALFPLFVTTSGVTNAARATELVEPPALTSRAKTLDILMVARPQLLPFTGQPAGYTYEVCLRPKDAKARRCPVAGSEVDLHSCPTARDPIVSPYGGVRLQLVPGDILRVRLINCLPPAIDPDHAQDDPLLKSNPTNLHTHGLIVEPKRADGLDDPFGDYVFVIDLPPGIKPPSAVHGNDHAHEFDFREEAVDYLIPIGAGHPAGLFWFHPHVHGIALNQVSGGLAGIITLEDVKADVCALSSGCKPGSRRPRHLILKDLQITSDYQIRFQENPAACATPDAAAQIGGCAGAGTKSGTSGDANDGRWEFTINGQTYADITIPATGDVWRLVNASASASYSLGLFPPGDDATPLIFQVLAIDGVSLVLPPGLNEAEARESLGGKVDVVACPAASSDVFAARAHDSSAPPVCATGLLMMPSARAEIFISGVSGQSQAVLRTIHRRTGPAGDDWPNIDLARILFAGSSTAERRPPMLLPVTAARLFTPGGLFELPAVTRLSGAAGPVPVSTLSQTARGALAQARQKRVKALEPLEELDCSALPDGRVRQILFGLPENKDRFGLGYRFGVAADDTSAPSPRAVKIVEFDHAARPTVCVQLGPGNKTVTEKWVLVNLAAEDHNFHIHQTRFSVLTTSVSGYRANRGSAPVLIDNVPLPHATGEACDGTIGPWLSGSCKPTFVTISIPFHEVGDFVYHCHILEHEDGGMMAKITVVPHRQ